MQKHCSGLKGKLENVVDFKCRTCLNQTIANYDDNKFRLRNVDDEVIDQIFYLHDMLSARRVAKASSQSCIRSGWKKFWALLSLLTSRVFSHKTKIKLFSAGVRSIMLYGSKFMPLKKSRISRIVLRDMQMVEWMCHVRIRDQKGQEIGWVLPK